MVFLRKRTWSFGRPLAGVRRKADLGLVLPMHNWLLLWLLLTGKVQFQGLCSVFKTNKTLMTFAARLSLWGMLHVLSLLYVQSDAPWRVECSVWQVIPARPGDTAAAWLELSRVWLLQKHADSLKDKAEALVSLLMEMQMRPITPVIFWSFWQFFVLQPLKYLLWETVISYLFCPFRIFRSPA